jgi:hypothetical protein
MKSIQTACVTAVLGLALTGTASAGIVANGSVAFSDFVASYVGATLSVATSITLSSATGLVTGATGTPDDFHRPFVGVRQLPRMGRWHGRSKQHPIHFLGDRRLNED